VSFETAAEEAARLSHCSRDAY